MATNLRARSEMEAEFKKICPEKWFTDVVGDVTSKFAGKPADGEGVKLIVISILQNLGKIIPKGHPFATKEGVIFELVDALTGDADLAAAAKICVTNALAPG